MQSYYPILKYVSLFEAITEQEFPAMLRCLAAKIMHYQKGSFPLLAGDTVTMVGILLHGQAHVIREDMNGNQVIITELQQCDLFAETFACMQVQRCPVTVQAMTDCEVMWIDYRRAITQCATACDYHTRLIANMLRLIAQKNLRLNHRLEVLSKRSIRERLLAYFEQQVERTGNRSFTIPFDRNRLADYLCADRSAMSRELGNMRDEGLLIFEINHFTLQ